MYIYEYDSIVLIYKIQQEQNILSNIYNGLRFLFFNFSKVIIGIWYIMEKMYTY